MIAVRVAVCLIEIYIPEAGTLKEKRRVLQSLIKRIRNQFNVSVTEVGAQDLWQRSELGLSAVCHNTNGAHRISSLLLSFIEAESQVEVISTKFEVY